MSIVTSRTSLVRRGTAAVVVAALAAGCATAPAGPSVAVMPGPSRSFEEFQADDASCRQWAQTQSGDPSTAFNQNTAAGSVWGTLIGAGLGAAIGAAVGNPAAGAAIGAGAGLLGGTASGANAGYYAGASVQQRYDIAYQQCMYAKGHQIPMAGRYAPYRPTRQAAPPPPPPPPGPPPPPPPKPS